MAKTHDAQELLTSKQAAAIAGVGRRAVQKWVRQGGLRVVQRIPVLLIDRADLEAFLRIRQEPVEAVPTLPKGQSFTLSDAARLCGVSRTTLQRAVRAGRLRLNAVHRLEKGELIHAGYFPSGPTTDGMSESQEQTDETTDRLDQLSAQMADLLTQHRTLGAKLERMQEELQALKSPKLSHGQARQLILAFMKRNPGPHNVREVQQGLGWTHTPRHHLRHLTNDGVLHRMGPGVYELPLSKNDCSQQ